MKWVFNNFLPQLWHVPEEIQHTVRIHGTLSDALDKLYEQL